jgi:hypothetical protein
MRSQFMLSMKIGIPVTRTGQLELCILFFLSTDKWKTKIPEKKTPLVSITNIPEAMNRDLYKVFEKYNLG